MKTGPSTAQPEPAVIPSPVAAARARSLARRKFIRTAALAGGGIAVAAFALWFATRPPPETRPVTPNKASLHATVSPNPVAMNSGDYREITYTFTETNGVAATITSRVAKFLAPTGQELSGDIGPYANDIRVNGFSSARWTDNVYLPPEVVQKARAQGLSSTILRTTFKGNDDNGNDVRTIAELTINIP